MPLINKRVKHGSIICSDTWKSYTGIAAKGYIHCLVEHGKGDYGDSQGNHINGLEGFWGYLKRKLASKEGIRKERVSFYLAEYVLRYNHRNFGCLTHSNCMVYYFPTQSILSLMPISANTRSVLHICRIYRYPLYTRLVTDIS